MRFINLKTFKYPLSIYDIKAENPDVSFPDALLLVPDGYAEVLPTDLPLYNKDTQAVIEQNPLLIDDKWYQSWKVVNLDVEIINKIKNNKILSSRSKRDALLRKCDWTQLNDIPQETKDKWIQYRQQLRDITKQQGFPDNIIWPEEPN